MDQPRDDEVLPGADLNWTEADEEEFRRTHPRAPTSSDEELLEADSPAIVSQLDDAARLRRIQEELRLGFERLGHVGKAVSIFGSARTPRDDAMYAKARETAAVLGRAGFSIITGGGPGIMEACNRGARDAGVPSIGLDIELPARAVRERLRRPQPRLPLLLRAQGDVRPLRERVRRLPRRLRHARRAVRGRHAAPDREDPPLPDRAVRHVLLGRARRLAVRRGCGRGATSRRRTPRA